MAERIHHQYDEMDAANRLLAILQGYAPDGPAQQKCTEVYHQAQKDSATPREMVKMLTGMLYDGLAYGNWPWTEVP